MQSNKLEHRLAGLKERALSKHVLFKKASLFVQFSSVHDDTPAAGKAHTLHPVS